MKSILHLIETGGPGGAEQVFLELATTLRVGELHPLAAIGRDGWLANQARKRGLLPHILPAQGSLNLDYAKRLITLIRDHDVQLIVAHLFGASVYASLAGLITRVPVISVLHGQSDVASTERFSSLKRWVVARGSARIVFVSDALRNDLQRRLALPDRKVAVIENGIDMSRLLPPDHGRLKESLGLPSDSFLIGAIGNVRAAKGYETLLHAARHVCDAHPAACFVIAGDTTGGLMPGLQSLHQQLGLEDRVRFLGLRSDVPEILAGIDVFVSSSHTEGFSLALVEAMASGKPSIATRSGGPERIIDADRTGLLVPARDAEAVAAAISTMMQDDALRHRLGAAAKAAITRRYSSVRMLEDYARLAIEVLTSRRR